MRGLFYECVRFLYDSYSNFAEAVAEAIKMNPEVRMEGVPPSVRWKRNYHVGCAKAGSVVPFPISFFLLLLSIRSACGKLEIAGRIVNIIIAAFFVCCLSIIVNVCMHSKLK